MLVSGSKLHDGEADIDVALAGRLIAAQFPQWADLPLKPIPSAGTDNVIYLLGDAMAVRLPRIHYAASRLDKECHWLPRLAPHLPLAIPVPLARGTPGEGYPFQWAVYRWLEGETATADGLTDLRQTATELAQFIASLQRIDSTGGPSPGPHNAFRGEPLAKRESETRAAIATLHSTLDTDAATEAWEAALQTPTWGGPPVWVHGDLIPTNLLAKQGRISAIIDFGCLGVGDPACDLQPAWNLLSRESRNVFRSTLKVDDATWARGRGWALSVGLIALPYY